MLLNCTEMHGTKNIKSDIVVSYPLFKNTDCTEIQNVRKRLYPFLFLFPRCPVRGEWCKLHWLLLDTPSFDWNTRRSRGHKIFKMAPTIQREFLKKLQYFSDTLYYCEFSDKCVHYVSQKYRNRKKPSVWLCEVLNAFQSNFPANRIVPSSYSFCAGKRLVDHL
jgi:hypothetical protein